MIPRARCELSVDDVEAFANGLQSFAASPKADPLIGRVLAHYEVLRKIGGGGMGVVYEARDRKLKRRVALKFLPPEIAWEGEAKLRLIREARAASALDHPHICTVFDIDETPDGELFIVMAVCQGETLETRLARGPLGADAALVLATQLADGLAAAHAAGIVHRDVKPANVMVQGEALAKILDFGLAQTARRDSAQTHSGLGTLRYMSPEQVRGEAVDGRTDVWSLGIVLYEMLAGHRPFDDQEMPAHAILNEEPAPLPTTGLEAHPGLPALVQRTLRKSAANRPAMAELFFELKRFRTALPPTANSRRKLGWLAWLGGRL